MSLNDSRALRKFLPGAEKELWRGRIVEVDGSATVPDNPLFCWVRPEEGGQPLAIYNDSTPHEKGRRVVVGNDRVDKRVRVLHGKYTAGTTQTINPNIGPHDHGPTSSNPVFIADWQILPLLVYATTGMNVHVNSGMIIYQGQPFRVAATDISLTISIPGSGARYSLIRVSSVGVLSIQDGTPVASFSDLSDDDIPVCAVGYAAIAFVRLYYGQTALSKLISNPDVKMLIWGGGLFDVSGFGGFNDAEGDPVEVDYTAAEDGTSEYAARRDHRHQLGNHEHTEAEITDLDHTDVNAIHDNVAGEIDALAEKATPVDNDLIIIEDSAASNAKKKVYIGNLPFAEGAENSTSDPVVWIEGALYAQTSVGMDWVAPRDCTIQKIIIYQRTLGSAGNTVVDVNINGVSIFPVTTKPTLAYNDADKKAEAVPDTTAVTAGDILSFDLDSVTTGGADLLIDVVTGDIANDTWSVYFDPFICGGRLTLTSGVPLTTSDVTGATTIYFTPFVSDKIGLYISGSWRIVTFTESLLVTTGFTASRLHDIFGYYSAGTLALEALAWASDTARATELVRQNGRLVKSGDPTRLYLGTVYADASKQLTDSSTAGRLVINQFNRVPRRASYAESTSHTYNSTTERYWNNDSNAYIPILIPLSDTVFEVNLTTHFKISSASYAAYLKVRMDGITPNTQISWTAHTQATSTLRLDYIRKLDYLLYVDIGYHKAYVIENVGDASGTATYGNVSLDIYIEG
jgi:hypothetical protein